MLIEIKSAEDFKNIVAALGMAGDENNPSMHWSNVPKYRRTLERLLDSKCWSRYGMGILQWDEEQRDPDTGAFDPPIID